MWITISFRQRYGIRAIATLAKTRGEILSDDSPFQDALSYLASLISDPLHKRSQCGGSKPLGGHELTSPVAVRLGLIAKTMGHQDIGKFIQTLGDEICDRAAEVEYGHLNEANLAIVAQIVKEICDRLEARGVARSRK